MSEEQKMMRLIKVAKELNVGIDNVVEYLHKKGFTIERNPNAKITSVMYDELVTEFSNDSNIKKKSEKLTLRQSERNTSISIDDISNNEPEPEITENEELIIKDSTKTFDQMPKIIGKINLPETTTPVKQKEKTTKKEPKAKEGEQPKKPAQAAKKSKAGEDKTGLPKKTDEAKDESGKPDTVVTPSKAESPGKEQKTVVDSQSKADEFSAGPVPDSTGQDVPVKDVTPLQDNIFRLEPHKLKTPKVMGKIDLVPVIVTKPDKKKSPEHGNSEAEIAKKKKKRKRLKQHKVSETDFSNETPKVPNQHSIVKKSSKQYGKGKKKGHKVEVDNEEVERSVKDTLASLSAKSKSSAAKYRREKRDAVSQKAQDEIEKLEGEKNVLKITEFVSVNELATLMNVAVNEVIATCMNLGLFVSINQRLDAESLSVIADEFGYKVEFITVEVQSDLIEQEEDDKEGLEPRPPIVTVMGHVDHGKTKLLDYIRNTNVVAGEAGGITQHIGAYNVSLENGRQITFLDTPGHEAFTAMRARGAQLTDVAIIVIAADDGVKPQTIEAINHAQAAGVPMVFAINKIDKPGANAEKIREELSKMNILVEEWGGKYQSQEIAAKPGTNVPMLLDKVMLEADILDLKANPNRPAVGVVIESSLDKGRGYITNILVKTGTLKIGDIVLAGSYYGKVKAMFNERNIRIKVSGPSTPVQILGLNGAPQAGDKFKVMKIEQEAKDIAGKRTQILREQGLRTQKHITLEEIGRRLAIGNFKELNVIVKGDVDGSIEALSDSLIKLSNEEIQVNVIHKAVGQISESDIMLAAASNAIIIGFQVRPSSNARKIAEKEQIQIRLYSIIYDAIEEIKQAMEGMLSPVIKEEITGSAEIQQVFKIGKVGSIAGCMVNEGKISRTSRVRIIRDGIVVYTGELGSLKRFKDDVKEVASGLECGLNIVRFNDIKVGDIIEAFTEFEVKKKL